MSDTPLPGFECPLPLSRHPRVLVAHGGGGRLTRELVDGIAASFDNRWLAPLHDGAVVPVGDRTVAFTTDSFVVSPLFFPGGDIGSLAVHGTVNDLAMCGARPLYLSAGLIVEEGFEVERLRRVVDSMRRAAGEAGVAIVTGDTKVVERGKGDGLYVNTAGIGSLEHGLEILPSRISEGDAVILSGDVARHGIAIMAQRSGLEFETVIESDSAPLAAPVQALLDAGLEVHCLRDLTRGGLATALVEVAEAAGCDLELDERSIPVREDVRGACEMLGLDPLYVANEGRFVAFLPAPEAERAVRILSDQPHTGGATRIGTVGAGRGQVVLRSRIGSRRVVDMLSGEQLPRIC